MSLDDFGMLVFVKIPLCALLVVLFIHLWRYL